MIKKLILYTVILGSASLGAAQNKDTLHLTLQDALEVAANQAIDALVAKDNMRISYWTFRNYKADLLPSLTFEGTLPSYNKSLSQYQQPDGSYDFIPNNYIANSGKLSLSQNIAHTGGRVLIQSQLELLTGLGGLKTSNWLSLPATITLEQPLITARPLRWDMKIEPKRYKGARQQFAVEMESVSIKTIDYYFNALLAKINAEIACQTFKNANELYEISLGKRKLGLISENDLLQLKISKLNAEGSVITSMRDYQDKKELLRNYLSFDKEVVLEVITPTEVPNIPIILEDVVHFAYKNNPITENTERRMLEAQKLIAQAKVDRGFEANIYASVGFTNSALTFSQAYHNMQNRQLVSVGVRIPILDWGKGKGRVELAKSKAEVESNRIKQEMFDFERNISLSVKQYQEQQMLTKIAQESDSVARRRYDIAFESFVMGQINVLDINTAQSELNSAKRTYLNQIYLSWLYLYNIRQITLYDFETKSNITYNLN